MSIELVFITTLLLFFILACFFYHFKYKAIQDEYLLLALNKNFFNKKNIMRKDEAYLYDDIIKKTGTEKYLVIPQAPLTMFIDVRSGLKDHDNLWKVLGKKTVDFLIVDRETMLPVEAVELNGSSHMLSGRKTRDSVVRDILEKCGIKLKIVNLKDLTTH